MTTGEIDQARRVHFRGMTEDDPFRAAELRAQAHHARELACSQPPGDALTRRLLQIADEMEAEAEALEPPPDLP